ncbi:hypothetical protein JSO61_008495 [Riemerella anatipestifer]|uniref:hypothetical protein n=1 Tax=Riemerella anatipestifer TaxID=34085 RepID=UPI0012AD86C9|nr:hypothetical protein [Riemerella anatipestifer]MDY3535296.1 hypothetical protein [Riemerella anatipestifer]USL95086.1 hypothetical protein D1J36_007290 [Riemerella anatipestifer]
MKNLLLTLGLGIFTMCTPQKRKVMKQEISNQQKQEERLFYSEASGGEEKRGFRLINSQEELNRVLSANQFVVLNPNEEKSKEPKLIFPKNQQVILYHLGTFRAGMHKPQGIDSVKLVGNTLEVYMKKNQSSSPQKTSIREPEMQVQVITTPWMVFSVSKDLKFNNIILK